MSQRLLAFLFWAVTALSTSACGKGAPPPQQEIPADAGLLTSRGVDLPPGERIGANLPPINDYSRTHVYVDLMRQARRFGTAAQPWDEKALIGDDGWPVGDFGVFLMTGQRGVQGVAGRYHVSFTGRAKLALVASMGSLLPPRHDAAANRTTVDLDLPEGADQLALAFTQTGDGIRDLRVIRPDYDPAHPPLFTKSFLDHIARFKTLRFMDWLRTNNNPVTTWAERTSPERMHHVSAKGVPWEDIIELANLTGKDIWINIPVAADDDYVRQLARLLKARLNPAGKIYVEYSNEVWNGQFKQHKANFDLAEAEALGARDSILAFDGKRERNIAGYRRIAKRAKEISDLFRETFGAAAMMARVRPIFASQVVNPYATRLGLDFAASVFGPPSRYFYALAGAPYFNLGPEQKNPSLTADQVLAAMRASIGRLPTANHFEENVALASWYGLPFIAYEGGSDTFGPGSLEAKKEASLDPGMQNVCERYLQTWFEGGGGLFMWFDAGAGNWNSPYGTWELTTDLMMTDTPKIRCLDHSLATPPPPPIGRNTVPGTLDALAYVGNFPPFSDASRSKVRHLAVGAFVDYLLLAPESGLYTLALQASAALPGNSLDIAVNGWTAQQDFPLQANGWHQPIPNAALRIPLRKGFNTLRLTARSKTTGFDLISMTFTKE
jgi:hypothetical protein